MFSIDGLTFNIPLTSLGCKADFLDKYAERTEDGTLNRELIGVYFNYTAQLGMAKSPVEFTRLWDKLTEPVEFHTITLPLADGSFTFEGYFSGVSSNLKRAYLGHMYWDDLSFTVTGKVPARS